MTPNLDPDPREDRLPKWAQQELARLRREVRQLLDRTPDAPDGANVHMVGRVGEPATRLGRDVGIRFDLDDGHTITVRHVRNRSSITATIDARAGAIAASPVGASNVIALGHLRGAAR